MSDSTTTTTTTTTRNTERAAERAIALLRYEVASGVAAGELLEGLHDLVREVVLGSERPNRAEHCATMAEAIIRGLVACGQREAVTALIDGWAEARAKADAYGRIHDDAQDDDAQEIA